MRIFWDANLFIYWLEDYGVLSASVFALLTRMDQRGDLLVTSSLALGEVLVKPMAKSPRLVLAYQAKVSEAAEVIPFGQAALRWYPLLRQDRAIKPPDAVHLACAMAAGADYFITNDRRLARVTWPGALAITSLADCPI